MMTEEKTEKEGMIAIVRVRGMMNRSPAIRKTLVLLGLGKPNWCTIRKETPALKGMLMRVKDVVTWGPVTAETLTGLKKRSPHTKRGKPSVFPLHPPRKGYGRKGIKTPFHRGGALGNRKEKINELIQRML